MRKEKGLLLLTAFLMIALPVGCSMGRKVAESPAVQNNTVAQGQPSNSTVRNNSSIPPADGQNPPSITVATESGILAESAKKPEITDSDGNNKFVLHFSEDNSTGLKMSQDMERMQPNFNTEEYHYIGENTFSSAKQSPLSTFSIDVDTASYSNMRRFITHGQLPPADAVRIEELINYFSYDYPEPDGDQPFSISTEISECPWNENHYLAMIGLQGKEMETGQMPPSNLVFLMDVSGSMNSVEKLPLLKSAFKLLVNQMREEDKVSIVVYAGAAGVVLKPASGKEKETILNALDRLEAGGSTAGGAGIELAYKIAKENYIKDGNNRVILATDGDFNVGVSSEGELTRMIEDKRRDGIFLSVLGFGTGNYKDSKMESLADKGNGNYAYIDTILEAQKVLIHQMGSTLFTIAKDVKIQIEFNPAKIKEYRLVGYENRVLNQEDFKDDTKDAGELGAGHSVTAFYEIVPADSDETNTNIDELQFQNIELKNSDSWMLVKLRYKEPDALISKYISKMSGSEDVTENPSQDFRFASAVAEFGQLLRDSKFKGTSSYSDVIEAAKKSKGDDELGYRNEFIQLAQLVESLNE